MKKLLVVMAIMAVAVGGVVAQTSTVNHTVQLNVPAVALIGLDDANSITLAVVAPATAGDNPTGQTHNLKHLRYTTINASATSRTVTVEWGGSDAAPAGTSLHVAATVPGGQGTTGGDKTISSTPAAIITGIPSCVTGTAAGNGATLAYALVIDTAASLVYNDNHLVTITYTLTEDL